MTAGLRRTLGVAAVVGAGVAYAVASHFVSVSPPPAGFGTIVFALLPLFVVILAFGWRAHRLPAIVACIVAVVLLWREADAIGQHLPFVLLLQNVSANAALMAFFAFSLLPGHEPILARLAAMVRGRPLAPAIVDYTRSATLAWALFFAAVIVGSVVLHFAAPLPVWSVFANLLGGPLVALMFVGEYAVRRRVLRDVPHSPLSASFRLWWTAGPESERLPARPR